MKKKAAAPAVEVGDPEARAGDEHRYRSGEAARRAKMPPTTLRMWERRYDVISPLKSEAGQRLYSEEDVRRLVLLKALVRQGHSIGSIARLPREQLESLFQARPEIIASESRTKAGGTERGVRIAVVGSTVQRRLALSLAQTGRANHVDVLKLANLGEAGAAAEKGEQVDALVVDVLALTHDVAAQVLEMRGRLHARMAAVSYAYGNAAPTETLRLAGIRLYRAPLTAVESRQLAADLQAGGTGMEGAGIEAIGARVPRRFGDEELERLMSQSAIVQCECPQHLGELIMRLDAFERYSNDCMSRSVDDAVLHRHLGDVASRARAMLEAALERVVDAQGHE
ncbi:MerR family transcriptional regulator [Trinickia soli]|uniref:MerR family transcriptional regulator n=1 Tax=Trinickia soli TaxID=380675 RepID=UPI003FA3B2C7